MRPEEQNRQPLIASRGDYLVVESWPVMAADPPTSANGLLAIIEKHLGREFGQHRQPRGNTFWWSRRGEGIRLASPRFSGVMESSIAYPVLTRPRQSRRPTLGTVGDPGRVMFTILSLQRVRISV